MQNGNFNSSLCYKHEFNRNMLMCNYCGEWYHEDCIGVDITSYEKNTEYKCPYCNQDTGSINESIYDESMFAVIIYIN